DRPKGAHADPLQQLELAQAERDPRARPPRVADAEGATTAGAEHLLGSVVAQLDRVVTVRAAEGLARRAVGTCAPLAPRGRRGGLRPGPRTAGGFRGQPDARRRLALQLV